MIDDLLRRLDFERKAKEMSPKLLVLPVTQETLAVFENRAFDIKRLNDPLRLGDIAEISREIGRTNVEAGQRRLTLMLRDTPQRIRTLRRPD